jgi:rhodanese-related sulfurtransferase
MFFQGIGEITLNPRSINNMSDKTYHHSDSSKTAFTFMHDYSPPEPPRPIKTSKPANTFMLDAPPLDPPRPVAHYYMNEFEKENNKSKPKKKDRPYLILDIRDVDDYKRGRILSSRSYPAALLSRSVNFESKDMLKFKNVEGKLIVVVDEDESLAARFATTLIQRGYDNVFVLSGGLRVAAIKFPDQLIATLTHDVDDEDVFDDKIAEDQIHVLEAFLEEALTSGTSRLSSMAPSVRSGWPSRISSSQSNLPSLINGQDQITRHKPKQVPLGVNYYPPRPQRTSFQNSRRS